MHAILIRSSAPHAEGVAGHLHDAWCAQVAAAQACSDTADIAPTAQPSRTAIIMECLAALAAAIGGHAR